VARELVAAIGDNMPPIFWYGGAALDGTPLLALRRRQFPPAAYRRL